MYEIAEKICNYSRRLVDLGLMASMSGNISVKVAPGIILMTPTACMKDELVPDDLITVDLRGHRLTGTKPISTEGWMHLAMYRARPSIAAVVHAHPVTVTALGIAERAPSLEITGEGAAFLGPVATVEWFIPGTENLALAVGEVATWSDSIILRHHGAVTAGSSLEEAFSRMQSFEHVAQIYVTAQQLGVVRQIPEADIRAMRGA